MARFNVHHVLRHPSRRKIVEILSQGKTGAVDLMRETSLGAGTLYYHLSVLGPLARQDADKKYTLTELGRKAHAYLRMEGETVRVPPPDVSGWSRPRIFFMYIFSKPFSTLIFDKTLIGLVLGIFILWVQAILMATPAILPSVDPQTGNLLPPLFTRLDPANPNPAAVASLSTYWLISKHVLAIMLIFALGEVVSRFILKKKHGTLNLFIGATLSYIPVVIFSGIWLVTLSWSEYVVLKRVETLQVLFYVFEFWTLVLWTYALSYTKNIKPSHAAAIVFIVAYVVTVPLVALFLPTYPLPIPPTSP